MKIKEMSVDETNAKSMERRHSRTPSVHQQDLGFEWNEKHEELVKKWQERSTHYTKLHNMAGKHYSTLNSWLGIPTKVCLSLIASIEFSQLTNVESAGWSFYFNGVIALLTLALETVQDYLGFSPRSAKHYSAANIYEKLSMNIEMELCNPREKRVNVRAFMRHAKETLQGVKETAPDIPTSILDGYLKDMEQQHPESFKINQMVRNIEPTSLGSIKPNNSSVPEVGIGVNGSDTHEDPKDLTDPETDLQDEFDLEMQRKLQLKKEKIEQYQLQRFNE
jgi:hypothetical protein